MLAAVPLWGAEAGRIALSGGNRGLEVDLAPIARDGAWAPAGAPELSC